MKVIENIKQLFPIFILFGFVFGYLNLWVSYNLFFDIEIQKYLSLVDIAYSYLTDFFLYIVFFIVYSFAEYISYKRKEKEENDERIYKKLIKEYESYDKHVGLEEGIKELKENAGKLKEIKKEQEVRGTLFKKISIICSIISAITLLVVFTFEYFKNEDVKFIYVLPFIIAIFLLLYWYKIITPVIMPLSGIYSNFHVPLIIVVFSMNLLLVAHNFRITYNLKNKGKGNKEIKFVFQGKSISTNKNLLFIGETKSTMFLYDKSEKQVGYYEKSEIKSKIEQIK